MRIQYPESIMNSFNEVYAAAAPFLFMDKEKMEWDFIPGTPDTIKERYYDLLNRTREFEKSRS